MSRPPRDAAAPKPSPAPPVDASARGRGTRRAGARKAAAGATGAPGAADASGERVTSARHVHLGDVLKIERRYVVDGALATVTDEGFFKGVQLLGSTEHLLLEDAKAKGVRMIPIHTISEIVIVGAAVAARPRAETFDPSFG